MLLYVPLNVLEVEKGEGRERRKIRMGGERSRDEEWVELEGTETVGEKKNTVLKYHKDLTWAMTFYPVTSSPVVQMFTT